MNVYAPDCSESAEELWNAAAIEDPHRLYSRLRETRPLSRVPGTGVHLAASWSLIEEVLSREADFSANLTGVLIRDERNRPSVFELPQMGASDVIATADEPSHSVHRQLLLPRLAKRRIDALEAKLEEWTDEALGPFLAEGGGDFVPIAERVPARALAEVLGLPQGDVARFRKWAMMGGDMLAGDASADRLMRLGQETGEMAAYLAEHLERFRTRASGNASPSDSPILVHLAAGLHRGAISAEQAIGIAIVLFGAGGESTAALLGSAARWLAEDAELADRLRASPGLLPRFVEEVVRLEPPFKFHYRSVRRPCRLAGFELVPGDRVMLLWAAANRDQTIFEDPDALRLDRPQPKNHMGFGRGTHFCIGAALARLEATVLLGALLRRTGHLSLRPGARPVYARSIFVRRLERLDLTATRAA